MKIEPDEAWRIAWLRTLFRCTLCLPIGYMVSHTSFRGAADSSSWSPASEDMVDYVNRCGRVTAHRLSARNEPVQLAARLVSFSTYLRLFDRAPAEIPMLSLFEADFFSDRPSKRNPLYVAFNNAMKHVFYDRFYLKLPFWWVLALNHHFIRDESYVPVECIVTANAGKEWRELVDIETEVDINKESTDSEEASPATATQDRQPSTVTDSFLPLVSRCLAISRSKIESDEFKANCRGAVFQRHSGVVHVVVPVFFTQLQELLNRPGVTSAHIHQGFVQDGLLAVDSVDAPETNFEIRPAGSTRRLGKVRALPLSDLGLKALFSNSGEMPDNPDLQLLHLGRSASAA